MTYAGPPTPCSKHLLEHHRKIVMAADALAGEAQRLLDQIRDRKLQGELHWTDVEGFIRGFREAQGR